MVREGLLRRARDPIGRERQGRPARAYRKLAKQYHPDANAGDVAAEERFKEVSAAHDVLGDPEKRKEYDQVREMVASGAVPVATAGSAPASRAHSSTSTTAVASATCSATSSAAARPRGGFGRRGRGRGAGPIGPVRGEDLETELHLDFLDAVHGITTTVNLTSDAPCSVCGGTGRRAGHLPGGVHHLRRHRRGRGRPGSVLVLAGVPDVRRSRSGHHPQVQEVPVDGCRAAPARGEGPDPRRGEGRAAHPGEGSRWRRTQRRAAR